MAPPEPSFAPGSASSVNSNSGPIREREIDRSVLVNIAPDPLLSDISIDELRCQLRVRSASPQATWLKQYTRDQDTKLPRGNIHTSVLLGKPSDENSPDTPAELAARRRVLSASSGPPSTMLNISNRIFVPDFNRNLISPRPLGPTHVLVVVQQDETSQRAVYSQTLQVAINDLLFTLNAPNLVSSVPPRMLQELTRVGIKVPHLESFRALVVFLHTQNQAALMRAVIPEWTCDITHVLNISPPQEVAPQATPEQRRIRILGILSLAAVSPASVDSCSPTDSAGSNEAQLDTVAREVAETAQELGRHVLVELDIMQDVLIRTHMAKMAA
ncbi:hypothetical protein BDZ89DRAFT_1068035 [Hymenopellis radicata]|nr:hypothetical protein BDZ89DRAFT_1068035 [Hymenopellis radicata]